jgi:hypothetical protein
MNRRVRWEKLFDDLSVTNSEAATEGRQLETSRIEEQQQQAFLKTASWSRLGVSGGQAAAVAEEVSCST